MINGTLIAQAIHFFIAYCIIDRVFLRRAVAHILAYKQALAQDADTIAQKRELLIDLRTQQALRWREHTQLLVQRAPTHLDLVPPVVSFQEYYQQQNKQLFLEHEKEVLISRMTQSVCNWITHE